MPCDSCLFLARSLRSSSTFSSLLIGICLVTGEPAWTTAETLDFQFPSHRDMPCDVTLFTSPVAGAFIFQFPSHRDMPCDTQVILIGLGYPRRTFSSLLIGICLVTRGLFSWEESVKAFQFPSHRDMPCDQEDQVWGPS